MLNTLYRRIKETHLYILFIETLTTGLVRGRAVNRSENTAKVKRESTGRYERQRDVTRK